VDQLICSVGWHRVLYSSQLNIRNLPNQSRLIASFNAALIFENDFDPKEAIPGRQWRRMRGRYDAVTGLINQRALLIAHSPTPQHKHHTTRSLVDSLDDRVGESLPALAFVRVGLCPLTVSTAFNISIPCFATKSDSRC